MGISLPVRHQWDLHDEHKYTWRAVNYGLQCQPDCQFNPFYECKNPEHGTVYHWVCLTQGCEWKSRTYKVHTFATKKISLEHCASWVKQRLTS